MSRKMYVRTLNRVSYSDGVLDGMPMSELVSLLGRHAAGAEVQDGYLEIDKREVLSFCRELRGGNTAAVPVSAMTPERREVIADTLERLVKVSDPEGDMMVIECF